jgi:hypothetical protein
VEEITFQVQRDESSGCLVAWWDDPSGSGGISTQGADLRDLRQQIIDAVAVHFESGESASVRMLTHGGSVPIVLAGADGRWEFACNFSRLCAG